jgi:hypothetical protein
VDSEASGADAWVFGEADHARGRPEPVQGTAFQHVGHNRGDVGAELTGPAATPTVGPHEERDFSGG